MRPTSGLSVGQTVTVLGGLVREADQTQPASGRSSHIGGLLQLVAALATRWRVPLVRRPTLRARRRQRLQEPDRRARPVNRQAGSIREVRGGDAALAGVVLALD